MKLFGTDGIRGIPNQYPLLPSVLYQIGYRLALCEKDIIIGKDSRVTGDWMEQHLITGIKDHKYHYIRSAGIVTTPSLSYLCKKYNCIGIMITASHNDDRYNGIKIFNEQGRKISKELEEDIENFIKENNYKQEYIDWVVSLFKDVDFSGMYTYIIHNNGATKDIAPTIFKRLGIRMKEEKRIGLGINDISPKDLIIIDYDYDGDRCIMYDENDEIFDGDDILFNLYNDGDTVVGTIYTNTSLIDYIKSTGGKFIMVNVGDRNVTDKMIEHNAQLGGEQSGHIMVKGYSMTSDAIITSLLMLSKKELKKLSREYIQRYEKIPWTGDPPKLMAQHLDYNNCRTVIRMSGTEPILKIMVEGKTQELVDKTMDSILEELK